MDDFCGDCTDDHRLHFGLSHNNPQDVSSEMGQAVQLSDLFQRGFTFRVEHRHGGVVTQLNAGEERILLFRSDQAGAIAKITFSSIIDDEDGVDKDVRDDNCSSSCGRAVIHVLDVKAPYRGHDFGGLLFAHAATALLQRYDKVDCHLYAEEDSRRHNRLLSFYQRLGCDVKPKAKIQYVNNNDGETYRKIPMRCQLLRQGREGSVLDVAFLPVRLLQLNGGRAVLELLEGPPETSMNRQIEWLIRDAGAGRIQIQTTQGQYLRIDSWGLCSVSNDVDDFGYFRIHRVAGCGSDDGADNENPTSEVYILQSTQGPFLTIDCQSLAFSKEPSFWRANGNALSLTCTRDASPLRKHYRDHWATQSIAYVRAMSQRYLQFEMTTMTLYEGLNLLRFVPLHRFVSSSIGFTSVKTFSICLAEAARIGGHPDWIQLIALIHELGCVVCYNESGKWRESESTDYDWTRTTRSRIVGCSAPTCASFSEFRNLNPDERSFRDPSVRGLYEDHTGLKNVLLSWNGPEYLFHMLKHNCALIPDEGLYILRYFSMPDWHTAHQYNHLANEDDENLKSLVADFYLLRHSVRRHCQCEISDIECDKLWTSYYCQIAAKYGLSGPLKW